MTKLGVRRPYKELILQAALLEGKRRQSLREHVDQHAAEQQSLEAFIPQVFKTRDGKPAYPPRHVRDQFIRALEDDALGDTVIIAPPGSAKTNTAMAAVAWSLGRNPRQHIGYFSNTDAQAHDRSVAIRDIVAQSVTYQAIFPDVRPDRSKGWSEKAWFLWRDDRGDKDPSLLAVGAGTAIQGARLDRVVLDDVANRENMATAHQRKKVIDWIEQDVLTRRTPGARTVMICTRWAEEDPAAWAIRQGWTVVFLDALDEEGETYWPDFWRQEMIACPGDRHGYAVGYRKGPEGQTICWENRDEDGNVTAIGRCAKLEHGSRNFNLIYRGVTAPDEDAIFKRGWWRYWRVLPAAIRNYLGELLEEDEEDFDDRRVRGGIFVDLAHEVKKSADYTDISVWVTDSVDLYKIERWHDRAEFPEVSRTLKNFRLRYPGLPIYIEKTTGSTPLLQTLRREISNVHPWSIAGRDKEARADAVVDLVEAGNVYLPDGVWWLLDFIEECAAFMRGAEHDDQVDTTTMALLKLGKKRGLRVL